MTTDTQADNPLLTSNLQRCPVGKDFDGNEVFLGENEVLKGGSIWQKAVDIVKGREVPILVWRKTQIGNENYGTRRWVDVSTFFAELNETDFSFPDGRPVTYQDALDHFIQNPNQDGSYFLAAHLLYGDYIGHEPIRNLTSSSQEEKVRFMGSFRTYLEGILSTYSDTQKPFADLKVYDPNNTSRRAEYPLYFDNPEKAKYFVMGLCADMEANLMDGDYPGAVYYGMTTAIGGFGLLPHEIEKFIANGKVLTAAQNQHSDQVDAGNGSF